MRWWGIAVAVLAVVVPAWRWWRHLADFFADAVSHEKFKEHAATFFGEAAVLVFIFPTVDTWVSGKKLTLSLTVPSIAMAVTFMFIAGLLSKPTKGA